MVVQSQFIEMFSSASKYSLQSIASGWDKGQAFKKESISPDGQTPCIHYGELFTKYGPVIDDVISYTNDYPIKVSQKGDILFPASDVTPNGLTRCSAVMKSGVILGGDIIVLHLSRDLSPEFISYAINIQKEQLLRCVTGSVIKHISAKGISNVLIPVPDRALQTTFVEVMRQADKSKFDGLKSQFIEMFSGREYPQLPIRDIADITTGSTPSKSHPEYWGGSNPWVSAEDMKDKYVYDTVEKVTDKGYATCKHIPVNTLMYVCRGSIGVMAINKVECATNQSICTATCKADKCEVEFLYHSLLYKKDEIKQIGIGTNFKSLNQTTFSNLRISLPPIEEQRHFVSITTQADKSKYLS